MLRDSKRMLQILYMKNRKIMFLSGKLLSYKQMPDYLLYFCKNFIMQLLRAKIRSFKN